MTPTPSPREERRAEMPDAVDKAIALDAASVSWQKGFEAGVKAERERIASDLFNRNGFMVATSGEGKHTVDISFQTMEEMHEFHRALCDLSRFKRSEEAA